MIAVHSKKFMTVKTFYERGLWTRAMVRNAVGKAWITEDEYTLITGEDYNA